MAKKEASGSRVSEKYLDALRAIGDWTTVSAWAIKVGEIYPELLEKANKEAKGHKRPTTGIREIAARISSWVSTDGFAGHIEVDASERPKRVRILSEEDASNYQKKSLESDLEPLTRDQKIESDEAALGTKERYRITELQTIKDQLKGFFNLDFEFEHAKAILNPSDPGQHHPDNIQLLLKTHNRIKGNDNWKRFSLNEQIEYIQAAVKVQKLIASRMGIDLNDEVITSIIERLKLVY